MTRKLTTLLLLAVAMYASAQGRYCRSYDDFVAGRWTEVAQLKPIVHSTAHKVWVGGNDFKFESGDKATDKVLKKEALVVEYMDTLYVNLRTLRYQGCRFGNGYAQGLPYDGNKILFVTHRIGKSVVGKRAFSAFMFGAIGAAISETGVQKDRVCYLIDNNGDGKTTDILLLGDEFMRTLLAIDEKMLARYNEKESQKERESAANVLPLLKETGLVK
jgi:hypothetical protein